MYGSECLYNLLFLGQYFFESSRWSGAWAQSVGLANSWYMRGGYANSGGVDNATQAGVESITPTNGAVISSHGFRGELWMIKGISRVVQEGFRRGGKQKRAYC